VAAAEDSGVLAAPPATAKSTCVLLVEDDLMLRDTMAEVLQLAGYQVMVARHGQEALDCYLAFQANIGIVVTDLKMPVMDGVAFSRALRQMNSQVPIIVISGYPSEADRTQLRELRICQWIQKPIGAEVLLPLIAQAMEASRTLASAQ
jgi:CheY-like chemotaxis protein